MTIFLFSCLILQTQTPPQPPLVLTCLIDASESRMRSDGIDAATARAREIWLRAGIDWRFTQDEQYRPQAVVRICSDLPHYGMTIGRESVVRDGGYDVGHASVGLIIAHELGHVLGLRHVTESGNLMGPYDGLASARLSQLQKVQINRFDAKLAADVKPSAVTAALKRSSPPRHTVLIFAYQDVSSLRLRTFMSMSPALQKVVDATSYHELADDDPKAGPYIEVVRKSRVQQSVGDKDVPAIILMAADGTVLECVWMARAWRPRSRWRDD